MTTGELAVVGLGPGGPDLRAPEAIRQLERATDLVGYRPYLDQVGPPRPEQRRHSFKNREEAARVAFALDLAAEGRRVALVSSGDPGVFAMASAVVEALHADSREGRWRGVSVAIVPGVTAATAAAAVVGAPLGHDFCVISLSDLLKPWEVIEHRLEAAAAADFVLALYNPLSAHRPWQLGRALEIVGKHRAPDTPVVVARQVARSEERVRVVPLGSVAAEGVDMRTVLIVGSSTTRQFDDAEGRSWVYTPRSYPEAPSS